MAERPEDLNLPNSVIAKIIKDSLPEGVIVSKDARTAISKAASVFVLYSTSCANNFALQNKRKTITAQDVLEAMKEMEFDQFVQPLQRSLEAYRLSIKDKKEASEKRRKEKEANSEQQDAGSASIPEDEEDADDDVEEIPEPLSEVIDDS